MYINYFLKNMSNHIILPKNLSLLFAYCIIISSYIFLLFCVRDFSKTIRPISIIFQRLLEEVIILDVFIYLFIYFDIWNFRHSRFWFIAYFVNFTTYIFCRDYLWTIRDMTKNISGKVDYSFEVVHYLVVLCQWRHFLELAVTWKLGTNF